MSFYPILKVTTCFSVGWKGSFSGSAGHGELTGQPQGVIEFAMCEDDGAFFAEDNDVDASGNERDEIFSSFECFLP